MSKELGLSGCKLEILSDDVIRKYSSGPNYNKRLFTQINKQTFLSKHIFSNFDTPKIISVFHKELIYFDMDYIKGCNYYEYFSEASVKKIEKILLFLDEYFQFLINNSRLYKKEVVFQKISSKLLSFKKQDNLLVNFVLNYLTKIDLHVNKSFCHGDLTISNILFHSQKIYLIDFLDSYIDSFLVDLVKLKQDLYYHWILKINDLKNLRIVQCFNFIWKYIEDSYSDYVTSDLFYVLELINFLRIRPYLKTKHQHEVLNNIIQQTSLYEKFTHSHGRKVY